MVGGGGGHTPGGVGGGPAARCYSGPSGPFGTPFDDAPASGNSSRDGDSVREGVAEMR